MPRIQKLKAGLITLALLSNVAWLPLLLPPAVASAVTAPVGQSFQTGDPTSTPYQCGTGSNAVYTSINICSKHYATNAILDFSFAIINFLTDGAGLVIVGSLIFAGIQYSSAGGDPQATARATGRIRQSLIALLIFIFGFAILNYVIPAGFLK